MIKIFLILGLSALISACVSDHPIATSSSADNFLRPGDIVVVSSANDTVVALHPDGYYKDIVQDVDTDTTVTYRGLAWKSDTREVLIAYDSTTVGQDKIIAVSAITGIARTLIQNSNWSGVLAGITVLSSGDILATETNGVEKFSTDGVRIVGGNYPIITLMTTPQQVASTVSGGFVACSTGTSEVRTYDAAGNQTHSASSAAPGTVLTPTINIYGCMEMSNGHFATAYNGATDTVRIYDSTMSSVIADYSDINYLGDPRAIAQRANGNLLVTDGTFHHIVELTSTGGFVRLLGGSVLNTPTFIMVVPPF